MNNKVLLCRIVWITLIDLTGERKVLPVGFYLALKHQTYITTKKKCIFRMHITIIHKDSSDHVGQQLLMQAKLFLHPVP